MWLRTQNGLQLVNLSGFDRIVVSENEDKSVAILAVKDKYVDTARLRPSYLTLGTYKRKETAMAIVDRIAGRIIGGQLFYGMPAEDADDRKAD